MMANLICDMCHEKEATHFEEIMDGILNEYIHANLCDLCHADALKQGILKYKNGQEPLAFVPLVSDRNRGYKIEDKQRPSVSVSPFPERIGDFENEDKVNPMAKKFNVVVSLPKGIVEKDFADSVGVIREAKRKDGSLIKMKTGGIVYRFPLNVTKLSAMIKKHNLKKVDKYGQDTVWLSVFEKDAGDKTASPSGSSDL
jgi:hypothetical protein